MIVKITGIDNLALEREKDLRTSKNKERIKNCQEKLNNVLALKKYIESKTLYLEQSMGENVYCIEVDNFDDFFDILKVIYKRNEIDYRTNSYPLSREIVIDVFKYSFDFSQIE